MSAMRKCHCCGSQIRPAMDSHVTVKVSVRECAGTGAYRDLRYKPLPMCAGCWGQIDDLICAMQEARP